MRKILFIILGIISISSVGWYFYAKSNQTQDGIPSITDFSSFFPIGDSSDPTEGNPDGILGDGQNNSLVPATPSPFTQISAHAVAGFGLFTNTTTTTISSDSNKTKPITQKITTDVVRYVSRANGYVYEVEKGGIPLQISNVYIPNIYEAVFGDKGSTALLRFLRPDQKTIATYSVPIPLPNTDGTRTQKEGLYFPDTISTAVSSPDGSQIARITNSIQGALLSISSTTNTKKVDIIQTPFQEWLLSWPTAKNLYLQTKASAEAPGYLYRITPTEKKLNRVIGAVNGLTTLVSPSGTYVIYSEYTDNRFITKILNTKTNTTQSINIAILPEKCTWLLNEDLLCAGNTTVPQGQYPDAWYQGTVHFSDNLYRIYTASMIYDTLYTTAGQSFDMTVLTVDELNKTLYFIDKNTGLLWKMTY